MTTTSQDNKRIAKNTLMLYIRMLLSMAVSLYTSRVLLNTLGVSDFGIYGVVGGVVAMFGFLNSSMSGATSRFLTYEIGREDLNKLKATFCSALIVHFAIALVVLILAETIGLWFLECKLVIPQERMNAAMWVYQASIFSTVIGITQIPYNACIISHEKMDVYAYVELINVFLRLIIIYLLVAGSFDKLILYAILVLLVTMIVAVTYRAYCIRYFDECRFKWIWCPSIVKPMLTFSSWDLYGNASTIARVQGVNMLLNIFFGTILNAASSIASSVQGAVVAFASNVVIAVKPQIIKSYAAGDFERMRALVYNASKFTFLLLLLLSLPLMIEMHYVLQLWLGTVPEYAVIFCIYTLLFNFFSTISYVVVTSIHASGNIKRPSLINGSLYLAVIPLSYVAYKYGSSPVVAYIFNVCAVVVGLLSNAWTINKYVPIFSFRRFFIDVFLRCCIIMCISAVVVLSFQKMMFAEECFGRFIYTSLVSTIVVSFLGFYCVMNKSMRKKTANIIKYRLCKKD